MNKPLQVEIVRPHKNLAETIAALVERAVMYFLVGWFVMLVVPAVAPWHPGYWQTLGGLYVLACVQQIGAWPLDMWSRAGKKGQRR